MVTNVSRRSNLYDFVRGPVLNLLLILALLSSLTSPLWSQRQTEWGEEGLAAGEDATGGRHTATGPLASVVAQPAQDGAVTLPTLPPAFSDDASTTDTAAATVWNGRPELVERRDGFWRHYDVGAGRAVAVASAEAQHYQAPVGDWLPIEPRFERVADGFVVTRNSLRGSLARETSAAVLRHGDMALGWQPQALLALDADGRALGTLAQPFAALADGTAADLAAPQTTLSADGRTLTYAGHWTDPTLRESFVSGPGRLEQALILAGPPELFPSANKEDEAPTWLAFETTLYLFSGESLWAGGQAQTTAFTTAGEPDQALEIRAADGRPLLSLAAVLAYEQDNAERSVAGHYAAEPLEENVWRLRVLTPWAWWSDPTRLYPAVLDPDMHVIRTTQIINNETVWDPDDPDPVEETTDPESQTIDIATRRHFGETPATSDLIGLSEVTSDVLFETLPTLPQGATLVGATLVISGEMHGRDFRVEALDLSEAAHPVVDDVTLSHDEALTVPTYDCYNRVKSSSGCTAKGIPVRAEFELPADMIEGWYDGDNAGIRLRPAEQQDCDVVMTRIEAQTMFSGCDFVSTASPELFITYDEITLSELKRTSQVPSSDPDFFENAVHQYRLDVNAPDWEAVAARVTAGGEQVPLNALSNYDDFESLIFDPDVRGEETNFFVIDKSAYFDDTRVNVDGEPSNANDAWYQIQGRQAQTLPDPNSPSYPVPVNLFYDDLIHLFSFDVEPRNTLFISVTAPSGIALDLTLFPPLPGFENQKNIRLVEFASHSDGFQPDDPKDLGDATQYTVEAESNSDETGTWALAVTHSGACEDSSIACTVDVELIACPEGQYYARRFGGCQGLIYPHPLILPEFGGGEPIPMTQYEDVERDGVTVRVFSEGGFTEDTDEYGDNYAFCTVDEWKGMPLLGTTDDTVPLLPTHGPSERLIAVRQGTVCVTDGDRIEIVGPEDFGAKVGPSVRRDSLNLADGLYYGKMFVAFGSECEGGMVGDDANPFILRPTAGKQDWIAPWEAWSDIDTVERFIDIAGRSANGFDEGDLYVLSDTEDNVALVEGFRSSWQLDGDYDSYGWSFDAQVDSRVDVPNMAVASLEARFHGPADLDTVLANKNPSVDEIQLTDATVHQPQQMGGAYKPVQAVILNEGRLFAADEKPCNAVAASSCLELRNATHINSADWRMPDVDVGGPTGSVIMQSAGQLHVFSQDHPYAGQGGSQSVMGVNAAALAMGFNFKTFAGQVSTVREPCIVEGDPDYVPGEAYPVVPVIKGSTSLALPSLGDGSNGGPGLYGEFKICQTKLRQIKIEFNAYPPGITVGPSGMVIKSIGGTVWVNPEFVRIEISTGFQTADGTTFSNGNATLIIDTRGYFELNGGAKLLGTFGLDGKLVVAWNPLDILHEANLTYLDWFRGYLRLHMWRGQGWGDPPPYPWLPDNNDFHFTGVIGAVITIKEGQIGQFFGISLPRQDIEFGVEVSFGEFCVNSACTRYEWGVQGKITVMSFTIGAYISKSNVEFFVGDKGKTLIDQAASQAMAATALAPSAVPGGPISDLADGEQLDFGPAEGSCPEPGGVATCTFEVEPDTGEALITVAWSPGTLPTAVLHAPDGTPISAVGLTPITDPSLGPNVPVYEMEAGGQVRFTLDETGAFYTIQSPQPGDWTLTLDNLTGEEYYNVLFAANSPAPELTLTAPDGQLVEDVLDVQWTVTPADSDATVQLAYVTAAEYLSYTMGIAAGAPITAVAGYRAGVPIAFGLGAADGAFQWTPVGLASGSYYLVARVDHDIHGSSYTFSPGPFTYVDDAPPAVPSGLILQAAPGSSDGIIASWNRNGEADLAAYEVSYDSPSLDRPGFTTRRLRFPPSDPHTTHPTREQVRLVGLLEGIETTVCVRAIDASGNASACSAPVSGTPVPAGKLLNFTPDLTSLHPTGGEPALTFEWQPGLIPAHGYLLSWSYGCAGVFDGPAADQGPSNLDVGDISSVDLTGLPPGTYRAAIRGYRLDQGEIAQISGFSNVRTTLLSDGVDADGDQLPDDWAAHFDVQGAFEDPDEDGLDNFFERLGFTDPTDPDSDGDGFLDGRETFKWLTDACDPNDVPDIGGVPKLGVWPRDGSLRFEAAAGDPVDPNLARVITIRNWSRQPLDWTATASDDWLQLSNVAGSGLRWGGGVHTISVNVDVNGLEPGYYAGYVRINSNTGQPVFNAPQEVPVRLWVLRNRLQNDTRVTGYVFLDENANGVEDAGESFRVGLVEVSLINSMGAVMRSTTTKVAVGTFGFSELPFASYDIVASRPHFVVTTPNPLPVQVTQENPLLSGIAIGVARDADGDGVANRDEDVNGDGILDNDDTDGDGVPDYRDPDDDGDGVPTRDETKYGDTDGDGVPNYRDPDDDDDGVPTKTEGVCDSNGDGVPDYLDRDVIGRCDAGTVIFLPLVLR